MQQVFKITEMYQPILPTNIVMINSRHPLIWIHCPKIFTHKT